MKGMKMMVLALLVLGIGWAMPASGLDGVRIEAPEGWPVLMVAPGQVVYLGPDPEVEETMVQFLSTPSVDPQVALGSQVGAAVAGRMVVRFSPVHERTTVEGLAVLAQVVVTEEGGEMRYLFVAVVQGVGRAVVVQLETASEELLSRYFGVLLESAMRVRFGGGGDSFAGYTLRV